MENLKKEGKTVGLAVIIVGDNPASRIYVNNKKKACEQLGIHSEEFALPAETTEEELKALVEKLNNDSSIDGILTGWQTVKYDSISGKYLYNRCHLIGFQLTAENANELNLITGTRYLNVDGMLPFENMVADYVKETNNHVLYRVTPVFEGNDLVAKGVQIEAMSVEDNGEGIEFNVFIYNVQPGITIDYSTGNSALGENTIIDVDSSNSNASNQSER